MVPLADTVFLGLCIGPVATIVCIVLAFYKWLLLNQGTIAKRNVPKTAKKLTRGTQAKAKLSIVIPAYNEHSRLPPTLEKLHKVLIDSDLLPCEVIVVDDGSSDESSRDVIEFVERQREDTEIDYFIITLGRNMGKGVAVSEGILASSGDVVLYMDSDGATNLSEVARLYGRAEDKINRPYMICGRRNKAKCRMKLLRRKLSEAFAIMSKSVSGSCVRDTQCGFKLFTRTAAEILFQANHLSGWAFDVEIVFLAHKLGVEVDEEQVKWIECPGSKLCPKKDALKMLCDSVFMRAAYELGAFGL